MGGGYEDDRRPHVQNLQHECVQGKPPTLLNLIYPLRKPVYIAKILKLKLRPIMHFRLQGVKYLKYLEVWECVYSVPENNFWTRGWLRFLEFNKNQKTF